jgi:hypothetical protein
MFRLRQKHSQRKSEQFAKPDAHRILAEQSLTRAVAGGFATVLMLSWAWGLFSLNTGRIFPWFSILMGAVIGLAVQRFGRGLDWRFPVLAAILGCIGTYVGNLMIGVLETSRYIDEPPLRVLGGLSKDTMKVFFASTVSPIDHIYAVCAAGVAAFFANRRLNRREVLAIRTMQDSLQ